MCFCAAQNEILTINPSLLGFINSTAYLEFMNTVLTPIVKILSHRQMGCSQNLLTHVKLPFSNKLSYPPQAQLTSKVKGSPPLLICSNTAFVSESLLWSHLNAIQ